MEQLLLEDFLRYRFLSGLKAAPGGEDLAFLCAMADREENSYPTDLWLLEKGETPRRLTGDGKTGAFLWDGPHTLLFVSRRDPQAQKLQEAGEEATAFYRLDTTGGEAVKAFQVPLSASPLEKVGDGRYLLSVQWDMAFSKAYRLKGKQKEELLQAKREERDYQVLDELPFYFNGKGYVNKKRTALFLYEEATGALTRVTPEAFDTASAHLSPDGKKLLYTGEKFVSKRREKSGVWVYDLLTGKTEELLPAREYELYDALWWGEKILLLATAQKRYGLNENAQFYTLDPQTREVALLCPYEDALGSSVGSDCRLGGGDAWTVHNGKLYFTATIRNASHLYALDQAGTISPVYTGEGSVDCLCLLGDTPYFVGMQQTKLQEIYAVEQGALRQATALNREVLSGKYVAQPQKLTFVNEGTDLDGWVLLPKDFDPQKTYPGILDIHGGPKTVYGEVFYHEMQVWANLGYFVFFCNPRGGDGRGNEFADLRGKYGTIDYRDLMAFTDQVLAAYPQLEETRLFVTGGSYGGFMTNWIVGHTQRFRAAATQRSIANWVGFGFTSDIGEGFARDQMGLSEKGTVWNSMEKLWEHSPLKYLDQARTPTLIIHSDEDYRCPISEGYQMYAALKQRGVEARMVIFHGENHELSRSGKPRHRVRRLREITQWFESHDKR